MTAAISTALNHLEDPSLELAFAAEANPEVLKQLKRLTAVTAKFARSVALCQEAAKILGTKPKVWELTQKLYAGDNQEDLVNLYNCLLCTQKSLKTMVAKTFRDRDIPYFAQTPVSVYQAFSDKFNHHATLVCSDANVAKIMQQYSNATFVEIIAQLSKNK